MTTISKAAIGGHSSWKTVVRDALLATSAAAVVGLVVYLGLIGGAAMLMVLTASVRVMGGSRYIWALGLTGVIGLTIGSAYSPRLWCYFMTILAVGAHMTTLARPSTVGRPRVMRARPSGSGLVRPRSGAVPRPHMTVGA